MLIARASAPRTRIKAACIYTGQTRRLSRCKPHLSEKHASPIADSSDSRLASFGRVISDDYAKLREEYRSPKHPIILAHGLFGFEELHIAGSRLPGVHYWRGITEALQAKGIKVYTASVPPSGSIEERAEKLKEVIEQKADGKAVNIIAGLDARFMISRLDPPNVKVLSLTTIATPHRGSEVADYLLDRLSPLQPHLFRLLHLVGIPTGAFSQLTRLYMASTFNPSTPDSPSVSYYSYGATCHPGWFSSFRRSQALIAATEGANDGLVSVQSSVWGTYKGTLVDVNHLDLINWTNRFRWWFSGLIWGWEGKGRRRFNAVAFYLDIADMLAKEGL